MPKDRLVQSDIQFFAASKMVWQWDGKDWDGAPRNNSKPRLVGFTSNPARVFCIGENGKRTEVAATKIGLTINAVLRLQLKLGMNSKGNGASHERVDPSTDARYRSSVLPGTY